MPKRTGKPWEKMFSKSSPVGKIYKFYILTYRFKFISIKKIKAIDLLKKLLTFDPKKRLTAE